MREVWTPVAGYETSFEVSDHGQIRSCHRKVYRATGNRPGWITYQPRVRPPQLDWNGYHNVVLQYNGKRTSHKVHRLVAAAFVHNPDPETLTQVNHIDFNRTNNVAWNLEWVTPQMNSEHAQAGGRMAKTPKWRIECPELGIIGYGFLDTEKKLREAGYPKADTTGLASVLSGKTKTHCGLSFVFTELDSPR